MYGWAPSSATTCAGGAPTGQQLTWDAEGRLAAWQNTRSGPTLTAQYLYDGEGNRVVQQVTDSTAGTTTTTSYIGSLETVTSNGTTTTTTDYASAGSVLAESVNGTLSYLATNYQGSVVAALNGSGGVTASQLYAPYGGVRYASGALPTDYGYTGQRADTSTGLDYYGARYYDPTLGQFTSADTMLDGLNRYGYVGGNPTTATDPSGHFVDDSGERGGGSAVIDGGATKEQLVEGMGGGGGAVTLDPLLLLVGLAVPEAWGLYIAVQDTKTTLTYLQAAQSTPAAASTPYAPDEMSRADARMAGISLSDLPYWNRHNVPNRTTPTHAAHATETEQSGPDGAPPQEASGGASVPPGGGRPPTVATSAPGDDDNCGCWFTKLYRAIGPSEDISQGLFPRQPGRNMSPAGHITNGSRPSFKGSQFISTSLYPEFAAKYGSNIVEIDVSLVQGRILDVSAGGIEYGIIPGSRAWYYAQADLEVLIDGWVPPEAIRPWNPGC